MPGRIHSHLPQALTQQPSQYPTPAAAPFGTALTTGVAVAADPGDTLRDAQYTGRLDDHRATVSPPEMDPAIISTVIGGTSPMAVTWNPPTMIEKALAAPMRVAP